MAVICASESRVENGKIPQTSPVKCTPGYQRKYPMLTRESLVNVSEVLLLPVRATVMPSIRVLRYGPGVHRTA